MDQPSDPSAPGRRAWPLVAVLAFVAALLAPAIAGGRVLATGDALAYYWPIRVLVGELWTDGVPPFWNPYGFGGLPLWSAIQAGTLFPGNLPFLFAPPGLAMNLTVALTYVVAGTGMLAFLRALGLPDVARVVGALIFTGCGFMLAHMEHLTAVQTAALLPWELWAIARHRETGDGRWAIALAALLGLQISAGYPQLVWESALVAGPYAIWGLRGLPGRLALRPAAELFAAGACGLGLGAVVTLPLAAFLGENGRMHLEFDLLTYTRFSIPHLATLFFPFMFGAPPSTFYAFPYWGIGPFFADVFGYVGLGAFALAIVALASRRTRGTAAFWAIIAAGATILFLGVRPIYEVLAVLPVVGAMRAPARHVFEFDVAIAVLAALGTAALLEADGPRARRLAWLGAAPVVAAVGGGAILVVLLGPWYARRLQPFVPGEVVLANAMRLTEPAFWVPLLTLVLSVGALLLVGRRPSAGRGGLLAAAIALDLFQVGQFTGFRVHAVPDLPRPTPWLADGEARVFAVSADPYPYRGGPEVTAEHRPYMNLLARERHAGGAEGFVPDRITFLLGAMDTYGWIYDGRVFRLGNHALDILSTRQVRIPRPSLGQPGWPVALQAPRWRRLPDADGLAVFENARALPRAWRVAAVVRLAASRIDRLVTADPAFDPAVLALVDRRPAEVPAALTGLASGPASLRAPDVNHLQVTTDGPGPGFLVVGEGFDAGWSATLDGAPAAVERVDGLVMGVAVPAGAHEVAFAYEPVGFRAGLAGSLGAMLALLGWWLALRRERRRA